jgi:hypothetical protein
VNADREKPSFRGTLGGLDIDPSFVDQRTGFDVCPPDGLEEPDPGE